MNIVGELSAGNLHAQFDGGPLGQLSGLPYLFQESKRPSDVETELDWNPTNRIDQFILRARVSRDLRLACSDLSILSILLFYESASITVVENRGRGICISIVQIDFLSEEKT